MIKEIEAKSILTKHKTANGWFGDLYNMNLYRGCEHNCIYCDSRSECYGIENFNDILVKKNAIELLRKELHSKREIGTIGTGAMTDPYTPAEKEIGLTGKALAVIKEFSFPAHIITKSDMVLKDMDVLKDISKIFANVTFTITTADDDLASKIEPNAPKPSKRLEAINLLAKNGIYVGVLMMPILPFVNDNEKNITDVVKKCAENGAKYIIPAMGVTLRDRQRAYFYERLKEFSPLLIKRYKETFHECYSCSSPSAKELYEIFNVLCEGFKIATKFSQLEKYNPQEQYNQLSMF